MTRVEYFRWVIQETRLWMDLEWIVSLLSYRVGLSEERVGYLKYENGECRYFNKEGYWDKIVDYQNENKGLFQYKDTIALQKGDIANLDRDIETTVGRVLQNLIMLVYPFGEKISYINKRFMPRDIEGIIKDRLVDTPLSTAERSKEFIYVDEYIRYSDACLFLSQLCQICVPGVTEKAITAPPGGREYLAELMDRAVREGRSLHDPATIADIGQEMERYDSIYLQGDRSLGFLINKKKDLGIVRKKMFLMYGFDKGFDETSDVDFIDRPLSEGIDYSRIDSYINGSRSGSFSRGAETQLAGVSVKEMLRASSNENIAIEDCHTDLGMRITLTEDNISTYRGFYCFYQGKEIKLDDDNRDMYLGKTVDMRSPAYCRCEGTSRCARCCGPHLSLHQTGISSAVADMGSVFLNTLMKAMHGKALVTKELDIDLLLS
nr:MAG TPA: DNA-directed RNA polymerase subunit alpha [Caudoviricetes sp.]